MDLATLDSIVTRHLGRYNASISWRIRHDPDVTAEQLAGMIEDRDGPAVEHMTGQRGYVKDRDAWWPTLVDACDRMLHEARDT